MILFWVKIAHMIAPIVKDNCINMLISRNTFSIMINHYLGFFLFNTICLIGYKSEIPFFDNFDIKQYLENINYTFWVDNNKFYTYFIYIIFGIFVPIIIQCGINKIVNIMKTRFKL